MIANVNEVYWVLTGFQRVLSSTGQGEHKYVDG